MDFASMPAKEKVLIAGGGVLALFFLVKGIKAGSGTTGATQTVDTGKIEQDLGSQVQGAVSSTSDAFAAQMQTFEQQQQDQQAKMFDQLNQAAQSQQAGLAQAFQDLSKQQDQQNQTMAQQIQGLMSQMATPTQYQQPAYQQQPPSPTSYSGTIQKPLVAPGGFELNTGDNYSQNGNQVSVTDAFGGVGSYNMDTHNYTWDYSHATAPGVGYTPPASSSHSSSSSSSHSSSSSSSKSFSSVLSSNGSIKTPQAAGKDNSHIGSDGLTDYTRSVKSALLSHGGTNYH
jgi:hypothetical protein